jgi:Tol biopolymer transport system component
MRRYMMVAWMLAAATTWAEPQDARVAGLAEEVRDKGWIAYGARSENGTWDLFMSRPDGSDRRNITNTPDFEEAAPLFHMDTKKLLYRRMPKGATINHDLWGFQGRLVIANADGTSPTVLGEEKEYPWATWSPDGAQLACLSKKGIEVVNIGSGEVVRKLSRKGIYQQLFWSADGNWFCGTANYTGASWTVVRMNAQTGEVNPIQIFQNCTPDWFPDSKHIIFSSRPDKQSENGGYGWTQLWMAEGEGKNHRLIYGEDGAHIYGGALSPDGRYVLFTRSLQDGAGAENAGAPINIVRLSDTPAIGGESRELRKLHPNAKDAPMIQLPTGWEPCWIETTFEERE